MSALVDRLYSAAFDIPRDPRSDEYKAGVRAVLKFRIDGTPISRPFKIGSAQDDAYYAGHAEGHAIWRRALADDQNDCASLALADTHASSATTGGAR